MAPLRTVLLAALFMMTGAGAVGAQQPITPPTIAIIDIQRILNESLAAKSIRPQVDKLRKGYQQEVRRQESELRKADQELGRQRAILAPEAYAKRRREFEERARNAQRDVQSRKRQLDRAFAKAMDEVRRSLLQIAEQVANERKISIVLPKSVVLLSMRNLDITAEALQRLDNKLPSVKVVVAEKK